MGGSSNEDSRRHRKSRRISDSEQLPSQSDQNSIKEIKTPGVDERLEVHQTVDEKDDDLSRLKAKSPSNQNNGETRLLEHKAVF